MFEDNYHYRNYTEDEKKEFMAFYLSNREYWSVREGKSEYPDKIFEDMLYCWLEMPEECKKDIRKALNYIDGMDEVYIDIDIKSFNKIYGTNYNTDSPYYKSLGLSQLEYVKKHFRNDEEFLKTVDEFMALPDEPKVVFEALHNQNIYNLRYVPNKIALVKEFCDNPNINSRECQFFINNEDLSFHDIVNFKDKKSNFFQNNYVKAVDKLISVISNDADGGNKLRKIYPLVTHLGDNNDEDEEIFDCKGDEKSADYYQSAYNLKPGDAHLADLYLRNAKAVNNSAVALAKLFGAQASAVIDEYLKINDGCEAYSTIEYANSSKEINAEFQKNFDVYAEDIMHEEIDALMPAGGRINASQLAGIQYMGFEENLKKRPQFSYTPIKFIANQQAQESVLKLCQSLPRGLTVEKSKSFARFVLTKFFHKQKDGAKKTRSLEELKTIGKKWNQLSAAQEGLKYNEILNLCRGNEYVNGRKDAFEDAFKISMGSGNDKYFDLAQSCYLRGINTPRTIEYEQPENSGDITVRLMAIDDPEVMMISNRCNICCQHIAGAGKYPAMSSAEDPFSRAMLIKEDDRPVGIAWLWTNEETTDGKKYTSMCIDNVELRGFVSNQDDITEAIKNISQKIAEANGFRRVTIGANSKFYNAADYFPESGPLDLPANYGKADRDENVDGKLDYNDSFKQCEVYVNPKAQPLDPRAEVETYVADRDSYTLSRTEKEEMNKIAEQCYPSGWQNVSAAKKDPQFKLLYDKNKNLMGYVSYSDDERNIYDMAVAPKYRGYSKYLINSLKAHGAELGGTWTADARDTTSFRLLKLFAAKGDLKIEELPGYQNIDGETLHRVKINMTEEGSQKSTSEKNLAVRISKLRRQLPADQKKFQDSRSVKKERENMMTFMAAEEYTI